MINLIIEKYASVLLTTLLTVLSGTIVYCLSQFLNVNYFEPIRKFNELKGKILYYVTLHADKYSNPLQLADENSDEIKKIYKEASDDIRKIGADVASFIELRPKSSQIPSKENLQELSSCLIGLSNSFYLPYNTAGSEEDRDFTKECRKKIEQILK